MDTMLRLLLIVSALLCAAGAILLIVAIFGSEKTNTVLCMALGCIALANLFNLIRIQMSKKDDTK